MNEYSTTGNTLSHCFRVKTMEFSIPGGLTSNIYIKINSRNVILTQSFFELTQSFFEYFETYVFGHKNES